MKVQIKIDSAAIMAQLTELGQERQGPFILSKTLNRLAKQVQSNLAADIKDNLKIKPARWTFIKQSVKIGSGSWSTKSRLRVTIDIDPRANFLNEFEEGEEHLPIGGRKFLAVPVKRVFGNSVIDANNPLRIKNLNLHDVKGNRMEGNLQTFLVHSKKTGTPLVLQRVAKDAVGKGRKGINRKTGVRMLYTLLRESHRPRRIHWESVANATVSGDAEGIWTEVISQALKDTRRA